MSASEPDFAIVYADVRHRLTGFVRGLDAEALATVVPATPAWTVKDVIGHVTGVIADLAAGNLQGLGSDEWTAVQVEARRPRPIDDVLAEWSELAPSIEQSLTGAPIELAGPLIGDVASHDFDLRGALGNTDGRDSGATIVAYETYSGDLANRVIAARLPAVRLEAAEWSRVAGDGEATTIVRGAPFELLRALTGRRSAEQVRTLDWTGDPEPYVPVFAAYDMRDSALVE